MRRSALRTGALLLLSTIALSGCHGNVKPLAPIVSVDDFCRHGTAKGPGILSIMSSVGDLPPMGSALSAAAVRAHVKAAGGVIPHWTDLALLLPQVAVSLGEPDRYIHVRAAALDNPAADANKRELSLLLHLPSGKDEWRRFDAYDIQNVCVEGSPKS